MGVRARRGVLALLGLVVALVGWAGFASPAYAAGDTYDRLDVRYSVTPQGVLEVTETIVLRFGSSSGRHGYERYLVTREPFDDDEDMVYRISAVSVSSPDRVSTAFSETTFGEGTRTESLRIRIGDANRTITTPTATYVLTYRVEGALRTPGDYSELYWDVTGSTMGAIKTATIEADVPGGAQGVTCFAGPPRTSNPCAQADISGGRAVFAHRGVSEGSLITIGVKIATDAVAQATPLRVPSADLAAQQSARVAQGVGAVGALAVPIAGFWYYRTRGRDERFAGLPPGMVPAQGDPVGIEPHDPNLPIPVAFAPPKLPLTYAGYLLEGGYRVEHLTATLVQLATLGAIRLDSARGPHATLLDPGRAPAGPPELLLASLFDGRNDVVPLAGAGQLAAASDALADDAAVAAATNHWFRWTTTGRRTRSAVGVLWLIAVPVVLFDAVALGSVLWAVIPITLSGLVTALVVRARMARGQRSAVGRAWTDQIEGFRTYIATAEADQLRFEEGEDIFSRYLPWAVLFGLADRWVKVCQQAIALGRLSVPDGSWYGGTGLDLHVLLWNLDSLQHSIPSAATPVSVTPNFSNDTGFGGGGSSFGGGGGFSGGGGGGGGGGSW